MDVPDDLAKFPDEERVVRDPLTGKSKLVPFVSYAEWIRNVPGAMVATP